MTSERKQKYRESAKRYSKRMRQEGRTTAAGRSYVLGLKLSKVRERARGRGVEFNLRVRDLRNLTPDTCSVLGIALDYSTLNNTPSLDRIDPRKGYVKENVRVISHRANTLKGNANWSELLDVALDSVGIEYGPEKAAQCAEAVKRVLGLTTD